MDLGLSSDQVPLLSKDFIPAWLCLLSALTGTADQLTLRPGRPRSLPPVWLALGGRFWVGSSPLQHQVAESRCSDGLGSPGRRLL